MKLEKKEKAKHLYFQTMLNKSQIAALLHISRSTLHSWIAEENWERLKENAEHMPSLLAENCYHIIAHFTKNMLSELRYMRPVTPQEAETLHKLVLTVNKLKNRSTINESMEMFGFFMDALNKKSPDLAKTIAPHVEQYLSSRATVYISQLRPANFSNMGCIPVTTPDYEEERLDMEEFVKNDPDYYLQRQQPQTSDAKTEQATQEA